MTEQPKTLGEHLQNRRLVLGLRQEDVAERFGTVREVYDRWERDERQPVVSVWPLVLEFLGYYPGPQSSPSDLTLMVRRSLGLEQKKLAEGIGVIHQRLRWWKQGTQAPTSTELQRLQGLLSEPLKLSFLMTANESVIRNLNKRIDKMKVPIVTSELEDRKRLLATRLRTVTGFHQDHPSPAQTTIFD